MKAWGLRRRLRSAGERSFQFVVATEGFVEEDNLKGLRVAMAVTVALQTSVRPLWPLVDSCKLL